MHRQGFNARMLLLTLVAVVMLSVVVPMAAYASESGRRNTAIALTGLAAVLLAKDKPAAGILAAVGAVAAWNNVDQDRRYDRNGYNGRYNGYQADQGRRYARPVYNGRYNSYSSVRDDHRFGRDDRHMDRNRGNRGSNRGNSRDRDDRGRDRR